MKKNKVLRHVLLSMILIVTAVIVITNAFTTPLLAASCSIGPCTCECATGSVCHRIRISIDLPIPGSVPSGVYAYGCQCYGADGEMEGEGCQAGSIY